ncbi:MAG: major capsid protein [Ignavibacteria bacterium]|nr:major capsid protein [Ignavibacteria bacterium]
MKGEIRLIDPVLTSLAQTYKNNGFVADHLFPVVQINKRKGKIPFFGKQAFVYRDTVRAIRSDSNRLPPEELVYKEFEMLERDVEISLDYVEEEEIPNFLQIEKQVTNELMDILLLGREKEVADFAQNPNNYASDMKMIITSATAFDDYSKNVDPIAKIREAMAKVRQKIARYPNVMIIGESTYRALTLHPRITERLKYAGLGRMDVKRLSELVEIPNIYIGLGVYTTDGINFVDIWSDNILLAYIEEEEKGKTTRYGLSYGYFLQKSGYPEIDTYFENGGKIKVIRATDCYTFIVSTPEACFLIHNTNHLS